MRGHITDALQLALLALSLAKAQSGGVAVPRLAVIGNLTARDEACFSGPQPSAAYLDDSFLGDLMSVQAGPYNYSYHQFGPSGAASSGPVGKPILLIAGQGSTWSAWSPGLLRGLAQNRSVTIYDHPGLGRTTDGRGEMRNYTAAELAEGVYELVTALELEEPDVLGYSVGGAVALTTVITYPDLFRKLILVDTGAGGDGERLGGDAAVARPYLLDIFNTGQQVPGPILYPDTPAGNNGLCRAIAWYEAHKADAATTPQILTQAYLIDEYFGYPSTGDNFVYDNLGNVTLPTFVIAGDEDIVLDPLDKFLDSS
ncbi:hypothetical protein WJX73_008378 [Symbiochloris irregularis]|uniref:AB hydrolase-1 domain-containing protein n=1 Tax=Symbiochloris irregularis TaxID=706552 RepID=A0AAW1PEZ7_9CHLO